LPKVTFLPYDITVEGKPGESILDVALENDIDLQHNCGGVCACSTCHVIVKKGMKNFEEMSDDEADQLDEAEGLTLDSRLGCQIKIMTLQDEDIIVEIPQINEQIRNFFHEGKPTNTVEH
jgi:2Fe-2S ferredoxin